ncbi:hypothetical protein F4823DRAFT_103754 [Ustulina deusta]|nr:hypothetical protein F4823DRAFT_103754 [Ustulina deusta]
MRKRRSSSACEGDDSPRIPSATFLCYIPRAAVHAHHLVSKVGERKKCTKCQFYVTCNTSPLTLIFTLQHGYPSRKVSIAYISLPSRYRPPLFLSDTNSDIMTHCNYIHFVGGFLFPPSLCSVPHDGTSTGGTPNAYNAYTLHFPLFELPKAGPIDPKYHLPRIKRQPRSLTCLRSEQPELSTGEALTYVPRPELHSFGQTTLSIPHVPIDSP